MLHLVGIIVDKVHMSLLQFTVNNRSKIGFGKEYGRRGCLTSLKRVEEPIKCRTFHKNISFFNFIYIFDVIV